MHGEPGSSTKKNEIALAKVGLTIVLIFILCHSVKWIPNIYELVRKSSFSQCFKLCSSKVIEPFKNLILKNYMGINQTQKVRAK